MNTRMLPLLLVLACRHPEQQQMSIIPPVCPPAESLYSATPVGIGRDLDGKGPYNRYLTIVIDSQYVLRNLEQGGGGRSMTDPGVSGLAPGDIEHVEVMKSGQQSRWKVCPTVPALLIMTKGRTWRPR